MQIKVNGETREVDREMSLGRLLDSLGVARQNLAIEHNGEFVEDTTDLDSVTVGEGDSLEIVRFVGGG